MAELEVGWVLAADKVGAFDLAIVRGQEIRDSNPLLKSISIVKVGDVPVSI